MCCCILFNVDVLIFPYNILTSHVFHVAGFVCSSCISLCPVSDPTFKKEINGYSFTGQYFNLLGGAVLL